MILIKFENGVTVKDYGTCVTSTTKEQQDSNEELMKRCKIANEITQSLPLITN